MKLVMPTRTTGILVFSAALGGMILSLAGIVIGYFIGSPSRARVRSLESQVAQLEADIEHDSQVHAMQVLDLVAGQQRKSTALSADALTILKLGSAKSGGITDGEPSLIRAGNTTLVKPPLDDIRNASPPLTEEEIQEKARDHRREYARWREALDELSRRGFVDAYGFRDSFKFYRVTKDGYDYLEQNASH